MENFDDKQAVEQAKELQRYEGKVVALVDNKVVASGESVVEVAKKAEEAGYKGIPFSLFLPGKFALLSNPWRSIIATRTA